MSWDLMVQFDDQDTKDLLDQKYEIEGIPTLVLVNGDTGSLITTDGREALFQVDFEKLSNFAEEKAKLEAEKEAKLANLRSKFELSKVFNENSIVDKDNNNVPLSNFNSKILGIYFSAHWYHHLSFTSIITSHPLASSLIIINRCPPCRSFTPVLGDKYNDLLSKSKPFDIIFVSYDRDEKSCSEYFSQMPWKCLRYNERETKFLLSELFEVEGIPTLVLIDTETGKILSTDGRSDLFEKDFDSLKTTSVFNFSQSN